MKHFSILFILLVLLSCNKIDFEINTMPQNNILDSVVMENAADAEKWHNQSIEGHFAQDNSHMAMMTTPEYYEYKIDAPMPI